MLFFASFVYTLTAIAAINPVVAAPTPTAHYAFARDLNARDVDSSDAEVAKRAVLEPRLIKVPAKFGSTLVAGALAAIAAGFSYNVLKDPILSLFGYHTSSETTPASKRSLPTEEHTLERRLAFGNIIKGLGGFGNLGKEAAFGLAAGAGILGLFGVLAHATGGSDTAPAKRSIFVKDTEETALERRSILSSAATWLTKSAAGGGTSPLAKIALGVLGSATFIAGGALIAKATNGTSLGKWFDVNNLKRRHILEYDDDESSETYGDVAQESVEPAKLEKRISAQGLGFAAIGAGVSLGGALFGDWLAKKARSGWNWMFSSSTSTPAAAAARRRNVGGSYDELD